MDFLEYYKLNEHPFSNVVDSRYYYNNLQQSEALAKLKYAIDTRKGLAVVIGDIGTGKTTLARRILEQLDEDNYEAALLVIIHSTVSSEWLFKKFAIQLGVKNVSDNKVELLAEINKRLTEINEEGRRAVVMMDEVQMLNSREIMEEFRGLLNMEMQEGKMVNFIFFGLPQLEDVLALDEPLKQRVAVRIKLNPYTKESTGDYIKHRLKIAGCNNDIFTDEAISLIYKYSNGIPRLINTICDNALLEGYLFKNSTIIDDSIIKTVAVDLALES